MTQTSSRVGALVSEISTLSASALRIATRVQHTLGFVSQSADTAQDAAASADAAVAADAVVDLQSQLSVMQQRIRDLQEDLEEATDVIVTDDELHVFRGRIKDAIRKTPLNMLTQAYDMEYFLAQPRSLRAPIAECLIELFQAKNQTPVHLWQKISTSGGVL
jgi:hypothetical protein